MLTVTDAAGAQLAQMLAEHGLPEHVAVRFVHEGQGIALQQDEERPGDTTFQYAGRKVLLLNSQVSELLADNTLDVEDAKLSLQPSSAGE